jgi:hypothetical protein
VRSFQHSNRTGVCVGIVHATAREIHAISATYAHATLMVGWFAMSELGSVVHKCTGIYFYGC